MLVICVIVLILRNYGLTEESYYNFDSVTVNIPSDDKVNGYRDKTLENNKAISAKDIEVVSSKDAKYCGNIATKKYHRPDCHILKRTTSENLLYSNDIIRLKNFGYEPCKICKP